MAPAEGQDPSASSELTLARLFLSLYIAADLQAPWYWTPKQPRTPLPPLRHTVEDVLRRVLEKKGSKALIT